MTQMHRCHACFELFTTPEPSAEVRCPGCLDANRQPPAWVQAYDRSLALQGREPKESAATGSADTVDRADQGEGGSCH